MSDKKPFDTSLSEGLRQMFLASVGAVAMTGEKGKEFFDQLVSSGEEAVNSGKELNQELKHNVKEDVSDLKKDSLYELLIRLSPQERDELLERVENYKDNSVKINIQDAHSELKHDTTGKAE